MKPVRVFDKTTGNGWWELGNGDLQFYDQQGIHRKTIPVHQRSDRPAAPPEGFTFSTAPGLSGRAQELARQQAFDRGQATAPNAASAGGEFDLKGAVKGMLAGGGLPNPSTDE